MSAHLTREDFAAMTGAAYVPLCESMHRCGRIASHYAEARHHCLIPRGQRSHVYPICYEAALGILNGVAAICPVCGQVAKQCDYVQIAGKVDTQP